MLKEEESLHGDFEYDGIWFLPESKNMQIHGKLKYSKGNVILTTTGSLHDDGSDFISQLKSQEKPLNISIIQGLSTDGKRITLVDCTKTGANLSFNGLPVNKYRAMKMFVGKHFDDKTEIKFTNFSIQYSNLYTWMANRPFNIDVSAMMEKIIKLEYRIPDTVSAKFDDDLTLEIAYGYTSDFPIYQPNFYIKQTTALTIKSSTALSVDDLMRIHRCFRYFLMLAMKNPVHPLSVEASLTNDDSNTIVFPNIRLYDDIPEISMPDQMLFPYPIIAENFESHIKTWYALWRKHEYALTTYFSTLLDASHITNEIMFQRVAQVIERYHREKFPTKEVKPENEEYNSMILKMKSKLSDDPKALCFIEKFEDMGKENNLQRRILDLVNLAPQAFNDADSEKIRFSENVMHTRNYHAHGIEKLREKAVTDQHELIYLTLQMMALLEGCFLTELPFTEEKRIELITKNRKVRNYPRDHQTTIS